MNERIKQLAVQAKIQFTYDPTETPMRVFAECWEDELEKFAELIVAECIAKIEEAAEYSPELYGVALDIQEHFGVK